MAKGGRPKAGTLYKPEYADLAYKFCLLGAIDTKLAEFFEVSQQTINAWKKKHPKFKDALRRGKALADAEVAEKLFERATGYEHPEEKLFCHQGEIIRANTVKHYPPDTAAAFIWLKNRSNWKDKSEVKQEGQVQLSDESVEALKEATENVAELLKACRS